MLSGVSISRIIMNLLALKFEKGQATVVLQNTHQALTRPCNNDKDFFDELMRVRFELLNFATEAQAKFASYHPEKLEIKEANHGSPFHFGASS
jgi:hypothetical protein